MIKWKSDTDFFFALIKKDDRLHNSAVSTYLKYKGSISTSLAVIMEILIISKKLNLGAKEIVEPILEIAKIDAVEPSEIALAAYYIDERNVSVFDAFHAALSNKEIISSDHIYDSLGIMRIKF